jgi:hypothetical protein
MRARHAGSGSPISAVTKMLSRAWRAGTSVRSASACGPLHGPKSKVVWTTTISAVPTIEMSASPVDSQTRSRHAARIDATAGAISVIVNG